MRNENNIIVDEEEIEKSMKGLKKQRKILIMTIKNSMREGNEYISRIAFETLLNVQKSILFVEKVFRFNIKEDSIPVYLIGSMFLYECYCYLTKDGGDEVLNYVSGLEVDNMIILDKLVPIDMEKQSPVYVSGKIRDTHKTLIQMSEFNYQLTGLFHSHPGGGKESTRPSSIDLNTQLRYEKGGYKSIGAIFTRDGFVRFFSVENKFRIQIHGSGVEEVEKNVFHLSKVSEIQGEKNKFRRKHHGQAGKSSGIQSGEGKSTKDNRNWSWWPWR